VQKKSFDNIQYIVTLKILSELGREGMFLNIIKAICVKPTVNIMLNGKELKFSLYDQAQDNNEHFLIFMFKRTLDVSARTMNEGKI
jgi:hypothetical protein